MTNVADEKLSVALADAVQAARDVPLHAVDDAQRRLVTTLQGRTRREPLMYPRHRVAAVAAMAALVLVIGLSLLPGHGDAFAAAQAHFRQFRTLQMDVVQRHGGEVLQTSRTRVDAAGVTRTDIGDVLSIIVDPARGRVLTLLHDQRQVMIAAIPVQASAAGNDIGWLDEMRRYTGTATPLSEVRTIAGQPAQGWRLELAGRPTELWANADGLPLEMRMPGSDLQIDYRFAFDVALAPGLFDGEIPVGYAQVEADHD
jgi:hypothetical protein